MTLIAPRAAGCGRSRHQDAADPYGRRDRRRCTRFAMGFRASVSSCSLITSSPTWALRLVEEHPEGVGYLLKDRVVDGADDRRRAAARGGRRDGRRSDDRVAPPRPAPPQRPVGSAHRAASARSSASSPRALSNRAIADRLVVAERTVENAHVVDLRQARTAGVAGPASARARRPDVPSGLILVPRVARPDRGCRAPGRGRDGGEDWLCLVRAA